MLSEFDLPQRQSLFAHCVGQGVNAVHETYNHRPKALAHADVLAAAVDLDMAAAGWTPTIDGYLGRVTKARILQAVGEAKGEDTVEHIATLKKGEMAEKAQELLAGSGWLPEPLRTPGQVFSVMPSAEVEDSVARDIDLVDCDDEQLTVEVDEVEPESEVIADEEAWPAAAE